MKIKTNLNSNENYKILSLSKVNIFIYICALIVTKGMIVNMNKTGIVGIVGGVGPYAGLELCKKILDGTDSSTDQGHLSLAMLSLPEKITDRTDFILGKTDLNPAYAIFDVIRKLHSIGAEIIAIACNTSYAPRIYDVICREIEKNRIDIKLVNIIDETINYIISNYPNIKNIGIISTVGSYKSKIHENALKKASLNAIIPSEYIQKEVIHKVIYDEEYGIKAESNPVKNKAKEQLLDVISNLKNTGADAIILGCTELSLAITQDLINGVRIIDSLKVFANAIVAHSKAI